MGLLDILNGMQNGPRGQRDETPTSSSGGMSPLTMALIGLLAYKAFNYLKPGEAGAGGNVPAGGQKGNVGAAPVGADAGQGGLSDLLKGGLGGLLAGGAAGTVLSGGLNDLLKQFQQKGQSDVANSWVSTGPNKEIDGDTISNVLGDDQIDTLASQSGMRRDELIEGLAQYLPELVNQLTPKGRLPTADEASRMV